MKEFIASYKDGRDDCWDLIFKASNHKEAIKEARKKQKEFGKLWSLRIYKCCNTILKEVQKYKKAVKE